MAFISNFTQTAITFFTQIDTFFPPLSIIFPFDIAELPSGGQPLNSFFFFFFPSVFPDSSVQFFLKKTYMYNYQICQASGGGGGWGGNLKS